MIQTTKNIVKSAFNKLYLVLFLVTAFLLFDYDRQASKLDDPGNKINETLFYVGSAKVSKLSNWISNSVAELPTFFDPADTPPEPAQETVTPDLSNTNQTVDIVQ